MFSLAAVLSLYLTGRVPHQGCGHVLAGPHSQGAPSAAAGPWLRRAYTACVRSTFVGLL